MNKLVITLMLVGLSLSTYAQKSFDRFEDMKDVTSLVMNQKMFKLLGKMDLDSNDPEMKNYIDMVNSLEDIKLFSTKIYSSNRTTIPDRSLGSNQVDLGGMTLPASATANKLSIDTG